MDWISVKDKLPTEREYQGKTILVLVNDEIYTCEVLEDGIVYLKSNRFIFGRDLGWCSDNRFATPSHWMPLPAPPKEELQKVNKGQDMEFKDELKIFISEKAFDGWADTTEKNVFDAIDEFFNLYQLERLNPEACNHSGINIMRDLDDRTLQCIKCDAIFRRCDSPNTTNK